MRSLWNSLPIGNTSIEQYERGEKLVDEAYERYKEYCHKNGGRIPFGKLTFALVSIGERSASFAAFMWPKGSLVEVPYKERSVLAVVEGYTPNDRSNQVMFFVRVRLPNGEEVNFSPDEVKQADVPQDVLKLAALQLEEKRNELNGGCR